MNKGVRFVMLGAMSLSLSTLAMAEEQKAVSQRKKADPNQMVCEKQEVLGSRLAVRRVCMTRAEWAQQRRTDRDLIDRSQINSCVRKAGC